MFVSANHDRVDHAGKNPGAVFERLPAAKLHVSGGKKQSMTAELCHPDFEGDASTGGRLFKQHRERFPTQRLVA
jgi:hypothetical protein